MHIFKSHMLPTPGLVGKACESVISFILCVMRKFDVITIAKQTNT